MKQKKEPIVKDERTMLLDGKIAGELVLGMTCFIAVSAFVRRISSGIDIRDMLEKDSWFSRIGAGVLFSLFVIATDVIGKRETMSFMFSPKYLLKIVLAIFVFALLTYLLEKPLALINRKKQKKIEAELEEE